MPSMRSWPLLALLSVSCASRKPLSSLPPPPAPVTVIQGAPSQAYALAVSLCDEVGPRLSGSHGDAAAVAWGLSTMKRLGFENVRAEPVLVPKWVRGVERAEVVSPRRQALAVTALGGSPSTPEGGVEAELLEVTTLDALKALGPGAASGRIVFANVPMRRTSDGQGYGEVASVRRLAGKHGLEAGAVAVMIRSVGTDSNRLGHTGQGFSENDALPQAAVSTADAELLHRLLRAGPVRVQLELGAHTEHQVESANVVGEVPGRALPGEVVLMGAHLDSWDLGTGALDDGAGVGIALDVGRQLLALPERPKRTVRVVLFANEENGLMGAKAYAAAHDPKTHVAALEADFGGDRALTVSSGAEPQRTAGWEYALAPLGVRVVVKPVHGGADLIPLRAAGVPILEVGQDGTRYFDLHHTANDTVDKLDEAALTQAARTYATVIWLAAN